MIFRRSQSSVTSWQWILKNVGIEIDIIHKNQYQSKHTTERSHHPKQGPTREIPKTFIIDATALLQTNGGQLKTIVKKFRRFTLLLGTGTHRLEVSSIKKWQSLIRLVVAWEWPGEAALALWRVHNDRWCGMGILTPVGVEVFWYLDKEEGEAVLFWGKALMHWWTFDCLRSTETFGLLGRVLTPAAQISGSPPTPLGASRVKGWLLIELELWGEFFVVFCFPPSLCGTRKNKFSSITVERKTTLPNARVL